MDFLTYIQKLQNELIVHDCSQNQIHTILTQESELAKAKDETVLDSFFTLDRLEKVIIEVKKQNNAFQPEESKTIVPQSSSKNNTINFHCELNEETTILHSSPTTTVHSLSDEATMVVISGNIPSTIEEKTIVTSPDLKKLLSENETVKISEKDTLFFQDDLNVTLAIPSQEVTIHPHTPSLTIADTDATLPLREPNDFRNVSVTEQTRPIPTRLTDSSKELTQNSSAITTSKKENSATTQKKISASTPTVPLSPETIRNPHPHVSFFWLAFLLFPSVCCLTVLITAFVLVANLLFLLAFTAVMIFYLSFLFIFFFFSLYSCIFTFLYWKDLRIAEGITELGLALFSFGLSLMFGYLFYRPFVSLAELIGEKCKSFNQKTFLFIRNLYRYSVKGAEKL